MKEPKSAHSRPACDRRSHGIGEPVPQPAAHCENVRRLEHILDSLPAGVVVLDGSGFVRRYNPAAEELLGMPLDGMLWREIIARAFAPRIDDGHEVSLHDGRRVSIATRSLGQDSGQLLLIKDVTETRRLQERVSHHQRLLALGEMVASLAHQVRTPLASAVLYISNLERQELDTASRRHFVSKSIMHLQHLERLVKHMLMFARSGNFACETLELSLLLDNYRQAMESALEQAGARLWFDGEASIQIYGNREALLMVLQNLALNALQAGARELTLSVRAVSEEAVDLILSDDGSGIRAEQHDRIFEPFFTTRQQGTGLGLAVVAAIVKAHDGAIWVDSQQGKGSRFTLRLMRVVEPAAPVATTVMAAETQRRVA